jgi:methylmalonyl-CoA/ethylmalonyl-CoA epimerase
MFGRLHHVGIAVPSIEAALPKYLSSLGASKQTEIIVDPLQQARVIFLITNPAEYTTIELVEPAGERSPLRRFVEVTGGGLHHLCYEVSDMEVALLQSRSCKSDVVSRPKPALAFAGRSIAWIMTPGRLLIELLEKS